MMLMLRRRPFGAASLRLKRAIASSLASSKLYWGACLLVPIRLICSAPTQHAADVVLERVYLHDGSYKT